MSNTPEVVDGKVFLSHWLGALTGMYAADINAIPDDKWTAAHGGCTKDAGVLTADALSMLVWATEALKGNVIPAAEFGSIEVSARCTTKADALATLTETTNNFQAALAGASSQALHTPVMAPFGMEMPLYMLAQLAVNHIWYHDGQLNFIKSLLCDEKVHWSLG